MYATWVLGWFGMCTCEVRQGWRSREVSRMILRFLTRTAGQILAPFCETGPRFEVQHLTSLWGRQGRTPSVTARKTRRLLAKNDSHIWKHQSSQFGLCTISRSFFWTDLGSNFNSNTQFLCDYGESSDFPEFRLKNKNNDFYLQSFCEDYVSGCWNMSHIAWPLLYIQSIFAVIME